MGKKKNKEKRESRGGLGRFLLAVLGVAGVGLGAFWYTMPDRFHAEVDRLTRLFGG